MRVNIVNLRREGRKGGRVERLTSRTPPQTPSIAPNSSLFPKSINVSPTFASNSASSPSQLLKTSVTSSSSASCGVGDTSRVSHGIATPVEVSAASTWRD